MKRLLAGLTIVLAAMAINSPELKAFSTSSIQEATTSEILNALIENQWKWTLSVSDQSKQVTLELVELTYRDGKVVEKSLIGEGGWFKRTKPLLSTSENIPLIILRFRGSNKVFFKMGLMTGLYDLPGDFLWPRAQLLVGQWRGSYLVLVDDGDGYDFQSGLAKRSVAIKIIEQ